MSLPLTFHPYHHHPSLHNHHHPIPPPALSSKRVPRLSAPFPTFLYASEPPPITARNKQRVRPSPSQLAELKALYTVSPNPHREAREALGRKIGMPYQSVTNWFQNQRSTAKKRVADPATASAPPLDDRGSGATSRSRSPSGSRSRMSTPDSATRVPEDGHDDYHDNHYEHDDTLRERSSECDLVQPHPPHPRQRTDPVRDIIVAQAAAARQQQLSQLPLPFSGAAIVPSFPAESTASNSTMHITLPPPPRVTSAASAYSRPSTPPLLSSFQVSRAESPGAASNFEASQEELHSSATDSVGVDQVPRGKRSRPTPHQLIALRALHATTSSPTIEERMKVGREIGMELGKVTNWFRNLRQTARKKERRTLQGESVITRPTKRPRREVFPSTYPTKRPRLDEDEDDNLSLAASHANSGAFDTTSTVGSVDMDYEYERLDAPPHAEANISPRHEPGQFRRDELPRYQLPLFDARDESSPFSGRLDESRLSGQPHGREQDHDRDHDQEARSEQGSESDTTHEAVTPEPQTLAAAPADGMTVTPPQPPPHLNTTTSSSDNSPSLDHSARARHSKHASIDDAMLLLAFHSAHV